MHFLHPFLLTLLPLVHNVSGQLYGSYIDKPAISTGFQYDNFDYDLDKFLKAKGAQSWTITPWKNSTIIPQYCHSSANDNGVASINVDVANIRFDDCFRDWTICRTQNGTVSWDNIARGLAKIPLGMRQYVSNLLIVPAIAQNDACGLTGWNGEIVIDQDCWNTRVLVHEFGHAMDRWAMQDLDSNFHWSRTSQWDAAINADTHVVTEYAKSNPVEDFAEVAAFSIMDGLANGGVGRYIDNSQKALVDDQLNTWASVVRPRVWSGNCNNKTASSVSVYKKNGSLVVGATPGVGVKRSVKTRAVKASLESDSMCGGYPRELL